MGIRWRASAPLAGGCSHPFPDTATERRGYSAYVLSPNDGLRTGKL
jgi:hypothetical protein